MGTLKIIGKIELKQFWPESSSDADTANVVISVDQNSFYYRKDKQSAYRKTKAFYDAYVIGKSKSKLVKNNKVKVRLQGIDAPELHYKAPPLIKAPNVTPELREAYNKKNKEFRQSLSESATFALRKFLKSIDANEVYCEVLSHNVDKPREVVDTYGRFVANIIVKKKTKKYDLNVWLAEQGWVFPTFYSSMSNDEMEVLLKAAKKGENKKRIWKYLRNDTGKFKYSMQYREGVADFTLGDDNGVLLMPKLFRRQVAYAMQKKVHLFDDTFSEFLAKSKDPFYKLLDFMQEGYDAKLFYLDDFIDGKIFKLTPGDLVFREKYSNVVTEQGKDITSW